MKSKRTLLISVIMGSVTALTASPTTYNVFLEPTPNPPALVNIAGNQTTGAPGFGSSSWQAPGTNPKQEVYLSFSNLFPQSVTVADVANISFWTNKGGAATDPDWYLTLYTKPTGSGDSQSWYHDRLTSEPAYTGTPSVASNTWHNWSTDPANPLLFFDWNRNGNIFGSSGDPTLATLQSGTFTWGNGTTADYRTSVLNVISLQTGSANNVGFTGLVDGLVVTLKNGDVANIDLVSTPEPSSMLLLGAGLGILAYRRRIRKV